MPAIVPMTRCPSRSRRRSFSGFLTWWDGNRAAVHLLKSYKVMKV
jgi:hypothetical protein